MEKECFCSKKTFVKDVLEVELLLKSFSLSLCFLEIVSFFFLSSFFNSFPTSLILFSLSLSKVAEVYITPGSEYGDRLLLRGEGNSGPDSVVAGDVTVIFKPSKDNSPGS